MVDGLHQGALVLCPVMSLCPALSQHPRCDPTQQPGIRSLEPLRVILKRCESWGGAA